MLLQNVGESQLFLAVYSLNFLRQMSTPVIARGFHSTKLREQLKTNFVKVAALSPKASLLDCQKHTQAVFNNAIASYKAGNIQGSYVEFHKFLILVIDRLPHHKDYNSTIRHIQEIRKWVDATRTKAFKFLESIVDMLDAAECLAQQQREQQSELDLIDEFDGAGEDAPLPAPVASILAEKLVENMQPGPSPSAANRDPARMSLLYNDCDKKAAYIVHDTPDTPLPAATAPTLPPATVFSAAAAAAASAQGALYEAVPDVEYPDGCDISAYEEERPLGGGLRGLSAMDAAILSTIADYRK